METYFNYIVTKDYNGKTIRDFLEQSHLSKSKIYQINEMNKIYLNGINVTINQILTKDDQLIIDISKFEENNYLPETSSLDVLYEDEYLLIINKPAGKIIFPDSFSKVDTIANMVSYYYLTHQENHAIRHLHRLDKETSGCLMYAKDLITHAIMNNQWENHLVEKEYIAIVEKEVFQKGEINSPIGHDRHHNGKMIISPNGQTAYTSYEVIKHNDLFSVLNVKIKTGRTHQIRLHLSSIGHPLLGDYLYGAKLKGIERVLLHANRIIFNHPYTNNKIIITAPMGKIMTKYFHDKK